MKNELMVFVRIGLYAVSGRLTAGGWLPAELQPELVSPAVVEATVGVILFAVTFAGYWFSKARDALRRMFR